MSTPRDILDQLAAQGLRPTGVADDSRQVNPGDLFLAYPGDLADGRQYIPDAIARGAIAVLWQAGGGFQWDASWPVPQLQGENLRQIAGPLAHAVYGHPTDTMSLIAVTGTNGKTTVTQWIACVHPRSCAVIGTLGAGFPERMIDTGFTTPEATTLMRYLAAFKAEEAQACAVEASSIGIAEGRLNGARVDVAVFTNFTRDHLDYHGSMEAYAAAKEALFRWPRLRLAVVNLDDPLGRRLLRENDAVRVLGYTIGDHSVDHPALIRAVDLETTATGQLFTLVTPNGRVRMETPVLGRYNVSNLLAVAAVLYDAGLGIKDIVARLRSLTPPAGRMEGAGGDNAPLVVVDYAHTPDALENVLGTLKEVAAARGGKLFAVFGCGGDRDRGKRPQMAEVAARLADQVVLTSDNPRSEDPQVILAEVAAGAPAAEVIVDRAMAIRKTIVHADRNDVVLLAGKGHEPYQEIRGVRWPFDDRQQAEAALLDRARRKQGEPEMRWTLADIARAVGGRLIGEQPEWVVVQGVSTDTRAIGSGQLFVALAGERFDAHDFLNDALARGAAALLVSRESAVPGGVAAVVVKDTRIALGDLAAAWRRSFDIPVIAVTGSNGKTTTKEMIASILKAAYGDDAVLATRGNLNNDIGLPLTLLGLDARHRAAVVEMGMNHPGEIAYLTRIGAPTAALVNNAQRAHLEGMGGIDAVAREKGSIYQGVPPTGAIVVNADDTYGEGWAALAQGRACWRFALDHEAEVRGEVQENGLQQNIRLLTPAGEISVVLNAVGRHNARNAVAAAAACLAVGVALEAVGRGLSRYAGVKGRLQARAGLGNARVLDDTYNANPDSVRAGIDVLAAQPGSKLLVLGDMGEVGSDGPAYHQEIGAYAKAQGVARLFALGEASTLAVQAFGEGATHFDSVEALVAAIGPQMNSQTTVLVKGSRFMKMERVADAITLPKEAAVSQAKESN